VLRWLERELTEHDRPEVNLVRGILSRTLYKRLWVVSQDMEQPRWDRIVKAWADLSRQKKHRLSVEVERQVALKVVGAAKALTGYSEQDVRGAIELRRAQLTPWLLVDIPEPRSGADVGLYYVHEGQRRQLRKDEKVAGSIQASKVWEQYAGSLLQAAGKIRIFCDPDLVDIVEATIPWEHGIETVIESLEAV
jgi:hypothetical protein